jgi:hypothetical protein
MGNYNTFKGFCCKIELSYSKKVSRAIVLAKTERHRRFDRL